MELWNRFLTWCGARPVPVAAPQAAPAALEDLDAATLDELLEENLRLGVEADLIRARRQALTQRAALRRTGV